MIANTLLAMLDHAVEERFPEAGESSVGASAGPACRPLASTGRVASFSRREMAQLGDEVKSVTCFAQKGEYDEGTVDA
jgi:hypothetical protein